MDNATIDGRYLNLIDKIFVNGSMQINIDEDLRTDKIPVGRGVGREVFKNMVWSNQELKTDTIRSTDDIGV